MGEQIRRERKSGEDQAESVQEFPAKGAGRTAVKATTEVKDPMVDEIDAVVDAAEAEAALNAEALERLYGEIDDLFTRESAEELVGTFKQIGGE